MTNYQTFKNSHAQTFPLLLANVWDANSAILCEKTGYKAIGTSSAAIAASLGYNDGEEMSFAELLHVVKSITSVTTLPLTVDLEAGYSRDANSILSNIHQLSNLGVIGINLEDSLVQNGEREIVDANHFSEIIRYLQDSLKTKNIDFFLNIRTDFFIMELDNALNETLMRVKLYEKAGANGIFVPCISNEADIQAVVASTSLPINVMALPQFPTLSTLQVLGVKRISMGPFLYNRANNLLEQTLTSIINDQNTTPLFA